MGSRSQESPRQTKPKKVSKRKIHEFRPFVCEFWCFFFLGKTSTIHISNFCSGMPLRKVHELTFLWFGLPGPLLKIHCLVLLYYPTGLSFHEKLGIKTVCAVFWGMGSKKASQVGAKVEEEGNTTSASKLLPTWDGGLLGITTNAYVFFPPP